MAQGRTASRVDWERASATLYRERPKRYRAFISHRSAPFFLAQRREWLAFMFAERSLPRIDADSVLPIVANHALLTIKELGPDVVLYGIHKKGASLLEDLAAAFPAIGRRTILYDDDETEKYVRGRAVMIFDDSIHKGDTCKDHVRRLRREGARSVTILVVVGSRDGLVAARKENVRVECLVEVSEENFTVAFGLLMVPTLGLFRNGALSNRPHREFRIDGGSSDVQASALRCLRALAGADSFSRLSEIPAVDGGKATVYHGTGEVSLPILRKLRERFDTYGKIDQVKFRVFLSHRENGFHLCLCAIVWPIGEADRSLEEINEVTEQAAVWLLDCVEADLKKGFAGTGFHVTRTASVIRSSRSIGARLGDES